MAEPQLSAKAPDWVRVCARTWRRAENHRIDMAAAGVAYFALLAGFPGMTAVVAVYGWVRDPTEVARQVQSLRGLAPPQAIDLLLDQMTRIAAAPPGALAIGAIISFLLALWALNRGVAGFRSAMIALDERRGRSRIVYQTVRSIVLTLSALFAAVLVIALMAVLPAALALLPMDRRMTYLLDWARWPVLLTGAIAYAAVLYRWGVNRTARPWSVATPAACLASIAWVLVSLGLNAYLSHFAALSQAYGSLTGAVVLILWLYLTAYVFLLGAEFSFVLENRRLARRAKIESAAAITEA